MGNIYESIAAITQEIGPIAKSKKNQQQGFMFRGVDDIMNELQPILAKHRVFIIPEVLESSREERTTQKGSNLIYSVLKIKISFYAEDGSSVAAVVIGEGMDSADKASNKAMAVGFKYACLQVFCIPTADTKDPDADSHGETARAPARAAPQPEAKPEQKKELTRLQRFNAEMEYAGLTADEAKKAVFRIADPFTFSTAKDAINGASEEDFKKIMQAIKQAAIDKEAANA